MLLVGSHGQRAGDRHPLLLSTRELRGVDVSLVGEADAAQVLEGDTGGFLLAALENAPLGDGEVLQRRQMGKQVEGLEDHADLAAYRVDIDIWVGHLHPTDEDLSGGGLLELEALVALGIAEERHGRFGAAEAADQLAPGPPLAALPKGGLWAHLPRFLRTGQRYARMDGSTAERSAAYEELTKALGRLFHDAARELAAKLTPRERILDVGAGSGVWSLAMAERSDTAHITAIDLPRSCRRSRSAPRGSGYAAGSSSSRPTTTP
jgi:hypothetical protein